MAISVTPELSVRVETSFAKLNSQAARDAFPPAMALSEALVRVLGRATNASVPASPQIPTLFATAAVDMWLRAIHSLIVSASLTEASPIWSSIAGYYSSHYCVRGFAHLLGHFQLFRRKRIVWLELTSGRSICHFTTKNASGREHLFYWITVKRDPQFKADSFFTENPEDSDVSDAGHRNRATYADHLGHLPKFRVLDENYLKKRLQFISEIRFSVPPIPERNKFSDLNSIQVIAYHRIVKFRQVVDEILGGKNRFWNVHRQPSWVSGIVDFQLTEQAISPAALVT